MTKLLFTLWSALCPALVLAQAPKADAPQPERITKVIRVRNGSATQLAYLARNGMPVMTEGDNVLKAVVISGKPSDVAEVERTLRELDAIPPVSVAPSDSRDIELTVYVVEGSDKSVSPPAEEKLTTIAPVLKQLRSIFPYKSYQLLSTMLLRSGQGRKALTRGLMKGLANTPDFSSYPSLYVVRYEAASISMGQSPLIHLASFDFNANVPVKLTGTQMQTYEVGIQMDIDLKEGEKVVVGKSNIESNDSALFIVLSAKLVP